MKILILIVGDTDATSEASEVTGRYEAKFGIRSCPGVAGENFLSKKRLTDSYE